MQMYYPRMQTGWTLPSGHPPNNFNNLETCERQESYIRPKTLLIKEFVCNATERVIIDSPDVCIWMVTSCHYFTWSISHDEVIAIVWQRIENILLTRRHLFVCILNKVKTKTPEVPYGNLFTATNQIILVCICTPLIL